MVSIVTQCISNMQPDIKRFDISDDNQKKHPVSSKLLVKNPDSKSNSDFYIVEVLRWSNNNKYVNLRYSKEIWISDEEFKQLEILDNVSESLDYHLFKLIKQVIIGYLKRRFKFIL